MIISPTMFYNLIIMLISLPTIPSVAVLKSDIKARPVRWGIVLVALLLAVDALTLATWMTFPAFKGQKISVSTSANASAASPKILGLLDKIQASGTDPSVIQGSKINRPPFSVAGVLLTLQGDNVQVFEYGSAAAASSEARDFLESSTGAASSRLYVDGPLAVLYTGNRQDVISTLDSALGMPFGK